jgi:hypothetical protein
MENMRKLIVLGLAALLTSVGVAGAQSNDQGRRLAGPFCIGKTTVSPLRLKNIYGQTVTVPRAGIVRSIGIDQKCNGNENRRFGVPVASGAGARGDSGPIGPQGSAGATGAKGASGATGDTGATGAQGPAGADGAQGQQGETGPAGAKGDTGATGAQGSAGADGAPGAKGDIGPSGATGAEGPAGAKGDTGATGAAGPAGAIGPAGPQGPAGAQGPAGPAGAAGLNGSTIITVAGGTLSGDKQFTVSCPTGDYALSGGFDIQGSVTASFLSSSTGDPTGNTSWTIRQSSGASLSGTVYVYCVASS